MRTGMRSSRVWAWGAVVALTIGLVGIAGPASAAPPPSNNAPLATADAVPVDDTVTVSYRMNRAAKQITQPVSCTLDTSTVDCGVQLSTSKKLTTYSTTLTGLAAGSHTFAVTFILTDGGTATAAVEFIIDTPTLEEACASLGGILVPGLSGSLWACDGQPYTGPQPTTPSEGLAAIGDTWSAALDPYCDSALGFGWIFLRDVLTRFVAYCPPGAA